MRCLTNCENIYVGLSIFDTMVDDDIYHNKKRYDNFIVNIDRLSIPLDQKPHKGKVGKYVCKNPVNLQYFSQLAHLFDSRDTSYIRRLRLFGDLKAVVHHTSKDLKDLKREDIDKIMAILFNSYLTEHGKRDLKRNLKTLWKLLFPELDERGRVDEGIIPYPVRHLDTKMERSKEKSRNDKLSYDEVQKLIGFFGNDPCMQAYISIAYESLGRPQEICFTRYKNLELFDNFGKLFILEHGKEGNGLLQIMEISFPYASKWANSHPTKRENDYLFLTVTGKQLNPTWINKKLQKACQRLGINKDVTAYSLKRAGVTHARLRGDSDVEIQHRARWTSTKQIHTYDQSNQEESFKIQLIKKGLIKTDDSRYTHLVPTQKACVICGEIVGVSDKTCPRCYRPLDRDKVRELEKKALDIFDIPEMKKLIKTVHKLEVEIKSLRAK